MAVSESVENYLEAILVLSKNMRGVHAAAICAYLGFSRPTVSVALKQMKEKNLVDVSDENHITLTNEGLIIAERIFERHNVIADMLISLGVDEETAYTDACKIEHDISDKSFECIKKHFVKSTNQ